MDGKLIFKWRNNQVRGWKKVINRGRKRGNGEAVGDRKVS